MKECQLTWLNYNVVKKILQIKQGIYYNFFHHNKFPSLLFPSNNKKKGFILFLFKFIFSTSVGTARVSLSELRIPLMWRDSDHFKNRGDHRRFAVFCLARIGTEIHDTALLCPVDRALTDITFPDVLLL